VLVGLIMYWIIVAIGAGEPLMLSATWRSAKLPGARVCPLPFMIDRHGPTIALGQSVTAALAPLENSNVPVTSPTPL